ncbi:MAG TPA: hypothetical protein VIF09_06620 [Polyangiaceae bacterium]|jgi:hypothetical protein
MMPTWLRVLGCSAGLALGVVALHACSLNPQPLPPGEKPDGSLGSANPVTGDGGGSNFGGGDADGGSKSDDAGAEGGVTVPVGDGSCEGGDACPAADAGDGGESDGPTDAASDGPSDGGTDTEEGGE